MRALKGSQVESSIRQLFNTIQTRLKKSESNCNLPGEAADEKLESYQRAYSKYLTLS
jgi:hypothetical protein